MTENKKIIRDKLKKKRSNLSKKQVETLSKKILSKLIRTKEYKKAKTILVYFPIQNEVDPLPLVSQNLVSQRAQKTFALPRICKSNRLHIHKFKTQDSLKTGKFGIKEPLSTSQKIPRKKLDLIITPGIAFDPQGHRIGYGKGYFDRLFKNLSTKSTKTFKIALAYDFQIIENVPAEKHDQKIDLIITEKRIIRPKPAKIQKNP